jgi:hypothetical protein
VLAHIDRRLIHPAGARAPPAGLTPVGMLGRQSRGLAFARCPRRRRYGKSLYRGIIATTNRLDGLTIRIRSSNFTNLCP